MKLRKAALVTVAAIGSFGAVGVAMLSSLTGVAATRLREGAPAPIVSAKNQDGETRKLSDHAGKWVLLFFYPKDDTPGCTKQACSLRDEYKQFTDAGVVIYGVSRQGPESHREFKKKFRLPFDLLADEKGEIGRAFGIGSMPIVGIYKRQSVLIDPKGNISKFLDSVDPATHSQAVLDLVRGRSAGSEAR